MRQDVDALLVSAFRGNMDAVNFIRTIVNTLHGWDDLVDRDKPLSDAQINTIFWNALIVLPRNPFYQRFFTELNPILATAIQNWLAANRMEQDFLLGGGNLCDLETAYSIRSDYRNIVIHSATLLFGYDYAQEVAFQCQRNWHYESLAEYIADLEQRRESRMGSVS